MMAGGAGRPLRFAAIMLCLWTASRTVMLWLQPGPDATPLASVRQTAPLLPAPPLAEGGPVRMTTALRTAMSRLGDRRRPARALLHRLARTTDGNGLIDVRPPGRAVDPQRVQLAMLAAVHVASSSQLLDRYFVASSSQLLDRYFVDAPRLAPAVPGRSRWSGSAWLLARGGGGVPAVAGASQLGGGQAGGRVRYRLNDDGWSAAAGAAVPLNSAGREAMLAIEWQPAAGPVRLVAEQRIALDDRISGGPGVGAIAGIGPTSIGDELAIEAYGQAGAIARDRLEPYAEGAARIARPVATVGGTPVELGLGIWAGAQRDAQRVDVGPAVSAAVPIAGQRFRVALDWRERVAGDARPNSGPALSIGTDF